MEPLSSDDPVEVAGYRLRARLGSGGMGRVYLAFTPAGRAVALKVVRPDLGEDSDFRRRFRQEAEAARRVHGLYTAQVLDADPDAVPPWLVTAYVPGPSLHEAVTEHGAMPEETVFMLLAGVAEALAAIHAAGVVHRDLKPSNVLLAPDGPRVIDFGIARAADATTLTRSGVRVGSPHFMAPEQVRGADASPAIDVFALGALGAFAALGRAPFGDGDEIAVLYRVVHSHADLSGCPQRLREVLERCLAKDPADRPAPPEIIALCRARTAGREGEVVQPWLPPAIVAALAQHAAPPPPIAAAAPTAISVTDVFAGALPGDEAPVLARPRLNPVRRGPLLLGSSLAAVGLAALLVAGVLTLDRHNANSAGPQRSLAELGTRTPAVSSQRPKAASPSLKPSPPAVDACLVGTWTVVADDLLNTINNHQVQFTFTGRGGYLTVRADGSGFEAFAPETMTATVNGNTWTDVFAGSVTMHVDTRDGDMLFSDVLPSKNASQALYENGSLNNVAPTTLEPGPLRYTCAGNTLRTFAADGSTVMTRKLPAGKGPAAAGS